MQGLSVSPHIPVLFDATSLPPNWGGVARYIQGVLAGLDELGVHLHVVAKPGDVERLRERAPGHDYHAGPTALKTRPARFAWEQIGLPRLASRLKVRVIHSPHYTLPLASRVANVVTLHDATFFTDPEVHSRLKRTFFTWWTRQAARRAAALITPSRATADAVRTATGLSNAIVRGVPAAAATTTRTPDATVGPTAGGHPDAEEGTTRSTGGDTARASRIALSAGNTDDYPATSGDRDTVDQGDAGIDTRDDGAAGSDRSTGGTGSTGSARVRRPGIFVAYLGVDPEVFHVPTLDAVASFAREHDLGPDHAPAGWIAFLGTIEPRKNIPALLRAHALLRERLDAGTPAPALVISGARGWDEEAARLLDELRPGDGVIEAGYLPLDDLPAFLGGARVVAYPSLGEGFGLPVLEAMASGAAVLTTRRLSIPEVGGTAVAYSEPDSDSLAAALESLLADPARRAELSSAAARRSAEFTWAACARMHVEAYRAAGATALGVPA
jgi:glycosyltransferase involved in cell wall biosynthesis